MCSNAKHTRTDDGAAHCHGSSLICLGDAGLAARRLMAARGVFRSAAHTLLEKQDTHDSIRSHGSNQRVLTRLISPTNVLLVPMFSRKTLPPKTESRKLKTSVPASPALPTHLLITA